MRILLVEDEKILAETLKKFLEKSGYAVDYVLDGAIAEKRIVLYEKEYDLVVLDWMLPSKDGLQICKNVRQLKIKVPIIMLTALSDAKDKIIALDAGADDYLAKPFLFEELDARIRALLRRPTLSLYRVIEAQRLKLDTLKHTVSLDNKEIILTTKEFSLLEYLMRNVDAVVPKDQITDHLWGFDFDSFSNVVDVHMRNLRSKIDDKNCKIIETIRGVGYRIKSV